MFGRLVGFVGAEVGPGVIGNIVPGPAFIPMRDAARAGSSIAPEGVTFGSGAVVVAELWGAGIDDTSDGG